MKTNTSEREAFEAWFLTEYFKAPDGMFAVEQAIAFEAGWQARAEQSRAEVEKLVEALQSIQEYWNRDRNDQAMHDACWHAVNTAADVLDLAPYKEKA